jgi:hypothetical protein
MFLDGRNKIEVFTHESPTRETILLAVSKYMSYGQPFPFGIPADRDPAFIGVRKMLLGV